MRRFDVERFLEDFDIEYADAGEHKHVRSGWIGVPCPFCTGNPGYHLGASIDSGTWTCWRCGRHSTLEVIQGLLNVTWGEAYRVLEKYQGRPVHIQARDLLDLRSVRDVEFPTGTAPLGQLHKQYLAKRGYDPDKLAEEWNLLGIGPLGGRLKYRVLAPITFRGKMVSYQCRDATDMAQNKYLPCLAEEEGIPHKSILYGIDKVRGSTVVINEGITDVWRLGPGAVATFGIKYTPSQINLLRTFKRRIIFYDPDPQAQEQADKLYNVLEQFNGETMIYQNEVDPGDMKQDDANHLMNELLTTLI